MVTCPNKNLPEWKEIERVAPDYAYTFWDLNNGNGIELAPNGANSKLFSDATSLFVDNRDDAILAKSAIVVNISSFAEHEVDDNGEPQLELLVSGIDKPKEEITVADLIEKLNAKQSVDVANSLKPEHSAATAAINKGFVHRHDGAIWLTKANYTDAQYARYVHSFEEYMRSIGASFSLQHTTNGAIVHIKDSTYWDQQDKIEKDGAGITKDTKEYADYLAAKFGLVVKVIPADKAPNRSVNAFVRGNVVYLVNGRVNMQIGAEECLHPFINTLHRGNPQLFDHLFDQAVKEYPKLWMEIQRTYSGMKHYKDSDLRQELVTQALARELAALRTNPKKTIGELLKQFVLWFKQLILNAAHSYTDITFVDPLMLPSMSLEDIAQLIDTSDSKFLIYDDTKVRYNVEDASLLGKEQSDKRLSEIKSKIQKGIKARYEAIKRYSARNIKLEAELNKLQTELSNLDTIDGIVEFVRHAAETASNSKQFFEDGKKVNTKQLRQLSRDYLSFYKPILEEIQSLLDTSDTKLEIADNGTIQEKVDEAIRNFQYVTNRFKNIERVSAINVFREKLMEFNTPSDEIERLVAQFDDVLQQDISTLSNWLGMSSSSGNAVTRVIAKMLNDSLNNTARETLSVATELTEQLQKCQKLYGIDVQKLLYEVDDDGKYTGYRVRKINHGKYKRAYAAFLRDLAEKMNVEQNEDGVYQFNDEQHEWKWDIEVEKWKSKYVERRLTGDYYVLRAKMLSPSARAAINEIQVAINQILDAITEDKIPDYSLLSEQQYTKLRELEKQKRLLANPNREDGQPKSGLEKRIADEITKFNETISDGRKYRANDDKFGREYKYMSEKYGLESNQFKLWYERSTERRIKDEFYERLKNLRSEFSIEPLEEELVRKRKELTDLFRHPITGEPVVSEIPDAVLGAIHSLDMEISELRRQRRNEGNGEEFRDFSRMEQTEQYKQDYSYYSSLGGEEFQKWADKSHVGSYGDTRPISLYTKVVPIDDSYYEVVPASRYNEIDENSYFYNDKFDSNGQAVQPKLSYFDNSTAYNEIESRPELKKLYDMIDDVLAKSNKKISFMHSLDNFKMPQIEARIAQIYGRNSSVLKSVGYMFNDLYTTKSDDVDYVDSQAEYADGQPIMLIPTRYIKMLEDTNLISTDAVASVIQYFEMATNYDNMSKQQNEVELLIELLHGQEYKRGRKKVSGESSNTYQQARFVVDKIMYGRKMDPIIREAFGKEVNVSKVLTRTLEVVRKLNLSGNIWAIGTGFITDQTYTTMEAKLGRYFDTKDYAFANKEYIKTLPDMLKNIGNPVPTSKIAGLMLYNQIVKENREVFDRLDQNRVGRAIVKNFFYLGYTQSDYAIKSRTLLAVYHSYRYVKGAGFFNKEQFINQFYKHDRKAGSVEFEKLTTTLYDAYEFTDNMVKVKDKYAEYVNEKLVNDVKNKTEVISRRMDGTLRDIDKTRVHTNSILQYVMLHRNFLVTMSHDRFKGRQFNFDTGTYEEGYYNVTGRFVANLVKNKSLSWRQIMDMYHEMDETERYGIRKVGMELCMIAVATTLGLLIAKFIDDDDNEEYDNWVTQSVAYFALRSAFEYRTMYNPLELFSIFKNPTAAFTAMDNTIGLMALLTPSEYETIKRGPYKGLPKWAKRLIKVTPFKNIWEARSPETKRRYLQNQMASF